MNSIPLSPDELTRLVSGLNTLAHNLWWTWNQDAQEIFQELSPRGWQNLYHNAVAVLHEVSEYELRVRLQEPEFARRVSAVLLDFDEYMNEKNTWGHQNAAALQKNPVAYFTAEFGFHETLPIAAGGLGILAGDHAKSASDLGIGFVGISLFYREGYFQQAINKENWQIGILHAAESEKSSDRAGVGCQAGKTVVCSVEIGMNEVFFQAWRVNVGSQPGLSARYQPAGKRAAFSRSDLAGLRRRQHHAHHAGNPARRRRRAIDARAGRRSRPSST